MPIATSLAITVLASTLAHAVVAETPATLATPPIIVNVSAPDLSPSLVRNMLEEADAIWRGAGVSFVWRQPSRTAESRTAESRTADSRTGATGLGAYLPSTLRVTVGDQRGIAPDHELPIGWIVFDDATTPEQEIYVSYANAMSFLRQSRGVVGIMENMPVNQREQLLGRAMGRALAHELGHYLMASKRHSSKGLMKATRTAYEFFTSDRGGFAIEAPDRRLIAARLHADGVVASR
jgi:hypothetical protein